MRVPSRDDVQKNEDLSWPEFFFIGSSGEQTSSSDLSEGTKAAKDIMRRIADSKMVELIEEVKAEIVGVKQVIDNQDVKLT